MALKPYATLFTVVDTLLLTILLLAQSGFVWGKKSKIYPFCDQEAELSFLWAIKRDPPAYFFGTIHVPYTRVWDYIPENAKQAFEDSDNIFFELDLMEPSTISGLATCQMLPPGKNLVDVLPDSMFVRLKRHLDYIKVMLPSWMTSDQRGRGLYADYLFNAITGNWERKRPVWVMLMVNALTESDVKSRGIPVLDLYLAQEAERMNKRTGAVERVEEQCLPLNGLNFSQVLFALNQTLGQHESLRTGDFTNPYTTDDLIKHYNCGDLNTVIFRQDSAQVPNLVNNTLTPSDYMLAQNIDEYFKEELIYKRNKRMADRVIELLVTHPNESFFFAFGAGHFLGNNTVLDFIKSRGFVVEQIPSNRKLKGPKKSKGSRGSPTWSHVSELASSRRAEHNLHDMQNDHVHAHVPPLTKKKPFRGTKNWQQTVHLLRTTQLPPVKKNRKFNDLWVRLDDFITTRPPPITVLPQTAPSPDALIVENSLRFWYGIPSSGSRHHFRWTFLYCLSILHWLVILIVNNT